MEFEELSNAIFLNMQSCNFFHFYIMKKKDMYIKNCNTTVHLAIVFPIEPEEWAALISACIIGITLFYGLSCGSTPIWSSSTIICIIFSRCHFSTHNFWYDNFCVMLFCLEQKHHRKNLRMAVENNMIINLMRIRFTETNIMTSCNLSKNIKLP